MEKKTERLPVLVVNVLDDKVVVKTADVAGAIMFEVPKAKVEPSDIEIKENMLGELVLWKDTKVIFKLYLSCKRVLPPEKQILPPVKQVLPQPEKQVLPQLPPPPEQPEKQKQVLPPVKPILPQQQPPVKRVLPQNIIDGENIDKIFKKGGLYNIYVGGGIVKKEADAGLTQQYANQNLITTRTLDIKTIDHDDYIFGIKDISVIVIARCTSLQPPLSCDASAELNLKAEVMCRLVEVIDNVRHGEKRTPLQQEIAKIMSKTSNVDEIMKSDAVKFLFLNEVSRIRKFMVRACETKAHERAQKKILNTEFREDWEIKSEDKEVEMANFPKNL